MPESTLQGKFNERGTLIAQMNEEQQKRLEKLDQRRQAEETRIRERQDQERDDRIKEQEDALTKKYELDISAPRPVHVPTPKMPTRAEIEEEARGLIQQSETHELDQHRHEFDLAEKRLIEKALNRQVEYQKQSPERDR